MGIGAGTGIAGSAVPHQIHESVTTAFVETNKAALAIVPSDTYAVTPFSQQDAHMFYRYEAKAGDPMIATPPMKMRMAMEAEAENMGWKPIYEELVKNLPTALGEVIMAENKKPLTSRNSQLVVFNNLLIGTAKFMNWVQTASIPAQPNTPEAIRNELNAYLPAIALQGAITNCTGILSGVENYLSELGANFIGHDQALNLSGELNRLLPAFDTLSKKAGAGEDVKHSFVALADATHRLAELNKKEGANGGFQILGTILNTLDTLAASAALDRGPSTLLVSSHVASFDHSGPLGTIVDQTIQGLESSSGSGIRGQLDELGSLQSGLRALRDS